MFEINYYSTWIRKCHQKMKNMDVLEAYINWGNQEFSSAQPHWVHRWSCLRVSIRLSVLDALLTLYNLKTLDS